MLIISLFNIVVSRCDLKEKIATQKENEKSNLSTLGYNTVDTNVDDHVPVPRKLLKRKCNDDLDNLNHSLFEDETWITEETSTDYSSANIEQA